MLRFFACHGQLAPENQSLTHRQHAEVPPHDITAVKCLECGILLGIDYTLAEQRSLVQSTGRNFIRLLCRLYSRSSNDFCSV